MENKIQMQINNIVNKVRKIEDKKVRRNIQIKQIKEDIKRLNDKSLKYFERYNFYTYLINLKSDEERERAIKIRKQKRRLQNA